MDIKPTTDSDAGKFTTINLFYSYYSRRHVWRDDADRSQEPEEGKKGEAENHETIEQETGRKHSVPLECTQWPEKRHLALPSIQTRALGNVVIGQQRSTIEPRQEGGGQVSHFISHHSENSFQKITSDDGEIMKQNFA